MVKEALKKSRWARRFYRAVKPILPLNRGAILGNYLQFWRDFREYKRQWKKPPCDWERLDPQLFDRVSSTPIGYYFYQDTWAFHKIAARPPQLHIDVGSTALFVGCLAGLTRTVSLDIRPLTAKIPNLHGLSGSILQLPLRDNATESLSSLCVLEHIGLGRYGDPINPLGTEQAARELSRALAPGGMLLVSVPCEGDYIAFNAHRSFERDQFCSFFPRLKLVEFQLINNLGFVSSIDPDPAAGLHVGLFHFTK